MKDYIKKLVRQLGLRLSLLLVMVIISLNVVLVVYYRNVMIVNSEISQQIQIVKNRLNTMESHIWLGDLGVRAYLIKQTDEFLNPYMGARDNFDDNLNNLEDDLKVIGFDIIVMKPAKVAMIKYMETLRLMVDLCDAGKVDEALEIFYEDRGFTAWQQYSPFVQNANTYVNNLNLKSENEYKNSINLILLIQIILIIISIPILTIAFLKIKKDGTFRAHIFNLIDKSNRNYLFDDGRGDEEKNEDDIITNLIANLKKSAGFINSISKGNYEIKWDGLHDKIMDLNKNSIAGELNMMRDQMLIAKGEDEIRIWANEGLSKFADLIRDHQNDKNQLSEKLISEIVAYMGAQQGGLFFVKEDEQKQRFLELVGCYAYERKKYQEKRIELGQGMVGQCFLEGETTHISNIPDEYVNITSGLGETNPSNLLIVPLKINEEIVGVIELAKLKKFESHQIEFVERLAESVASSILAVNTNEHTRSLLEQSQQQSEEMRAQEEEMRQNMEELQATQEQMHRKNEEVESLLKQASENEVSMKLQMEELENIQGDATSSHEKIKQEADDFRSMLMDILNEVPQKVFLKDAEGKMFIANQKVADAHGLPLTELIGKSDYDFVDTETADKWRKQELEIMKKGEEKYIFEDSIGGKKTILESVKKVFHIRPLGQNGLLGIQSDITEKVELENELKMLKNK